MFKHYKPCRVNNSTKDDIPRGIEHVNSNVIISKMCIALTGDYFFTTQSNTLHSIF